MKKHSKTGVDSRYQGTIIGKPAELRTIKIEGGTEDSIEEWCRKVRERAAKSAVTAPVAMDVDSVVESGEGSPLTPMES
jgi:transcription initiation factor TFIID subunit 3